MRVNEPRTAIVTGAASGMGLAIAERCAADGHRVAIFDLNGEGAKAVAATIEGKGGRAVGYQVDVTDRPAIESAVADVAAGLGPPTILVNNAGLPGTKPFLSMTVDEWSARLDVNLTGTFHCCQVVIPHMLDAGWGRIVNVSSSSTLSGVPGMAHYVASKAGVNGLSRTLSLEFAKKGITVNVILPGFIDTPMLRDAIGEGSVGMEAGIARTPVGRVGTPEDIAGACAYFLSDEASYVSGQILAVSGGRTS